MTHNLHLICKHGANHSHLGNQMFETGNWAVANKTADLIVGGRIYLHEKQSQPAWHGGIVVGWRASNEAGRVAFTYRVDGPFRTKCPGGWGREKAIVEFAAAA